MGNPFRKIRTARKMLHEYGFYGMEAFRVFWDMLYCRKKFHCTYNEYFGYKFYNFKNRYRKYFLLRYHQRVLYNYVDSGSVSIIGKKQQYTLFHDKIRREWMCVTPDNISEVESFIRKHGKVIFKPIRGSQGDGIFAMTANEIETNLPEKYPELVKREYLCEQYIIQHPKMSDMNSGSVNTIRMITLCDGKSVKIVSAGIRTGSGDSVCDNMSIGGIGAAIDMETGIIFTTGVNYEKTRYFYHPVSGTKIPGFEIPYWNEIKEMIAECAMRVNTAAVVGWDVAITEDGPCLIEANNRPAGKLVQISTDQPLGKEIVDYIHSHRHNNYKKMSKEQKNYCRVYEKRYG